MAKLSADEQDDIAHAVVRLTGTDEEQPIAFGADQRPSAHSDLNAILDQIPAHSLLRARRVQCRIRVALGGDPSTDVNKGCFAGQAAARLLIRARAPT